VNRRARGAGTVASFVRGCGLLWHWQRWHVFSGEAGTSRNSRVRSARCTQALSIWNLPPVLLSGCQVHVSHYHRKILLLPCKVVDDANTDY
jgi:hypothetical protein